MLAGKIKFQNTKEENKDEKNDCDNQLMNVLMKSILMGNAIKEADSILEENKNENDANVINNDDIKVDINQQISVKGMKKKY